MPTIPSLCAPHDAPVRRILLTALLAAPAPAQTAWTLLAPTASPPAYTAHAMAHHLPSDRTVLFGGVFAGVRSDLTWLFDGTTWTQASPANVPPARVAHTLTHDVGRGRLVLFGGLGATGATLGDTWEWDGVDWSQPAPGLAPAGRWAHCAAYHPLRAKVLVFGGFAGGNQNDLWEWDGAAWTQIVTPVSPSARRATAMAFDPVSGHLLLFSGWQQAADTWLFDGATWVQQSPATSPPARYDHAMETDFARNRVVVYGSTIFADTWEWDGTTWLDRTVPGAMPAPRVDTYLAWNLVREELTMFGSSPSPETWRYAPTWPARYTPQNATGCPGTNGQWPVLATNQRPWIGETFAVAIHQLAPGAIALMVSGLSDTTWALGALPFPLAAIGMPGCLLRVDPFLIDALLPAGGTATWVRAVPLDPALLGARFWQQAGALDPGANAADLVVGDYAEAVLGGK